MLKKLTPDKIRVLALILLLPFGALGVSALRAPELQEVISHGPIQSGHDGVNCKDCHIDAEASLRQQMQANMRYLIGLREEPVDFGYKPVTSVECLTCHERPNERHPIYRFREPRFVSAVKDVAATSCLGCHTEHEDQMSFAEPQFCRSCHEDLELKNDPVDVPHITLVAEGNWDSCMGCHDFHGNHLSQAPVRITDAIEINEIVNYLANGPSPYGDQKAYEAELK